MKLVIVTWLDSTHAKAQWKWLDEFGDRGFHDIPVIVSVGMVLQNDAEGITLAPSVGNINNEDKQVSGWFTIPRGSIQSVEELRDVGS